RRQRREREGKQGGSATAGELLLSYPLFLSSVFSVSSVPLWFSSSALRHPALDAVGGTVVPEPLLGRGVPILEEEADVLIRALLRRLPAVLRHQAEGLEDAARRGLVDGHVGLRPVGPGDGIQDELALGRVDRLGRGVRAGAGLVARQQQRGGEQA